MITDIRSPVLKLKSLEKLSNHFRQNETCLTLAMRKSLVQNSEHCQWHHLMAVLPESLSEDLLFPFFSPNFK